MTMTSFTLVGNSADSRGLADVTPCIATPNRDREGPHGLPPPTPPDRRVTSPAVR